MEVVTKSPENLCPHCTEECDYVKFRKDVRKDHQHLNTKGSGEYFDMGFYGSFIGNKAFEDLLLDQNKTLTDQGLREIVRGL